MHPIFAISHPFLGDMVERGGVTYTEGGDDHGVVTGPTFGSGSTN